MLEPARFPTLRPAAALLAALLLLLSPGSAQAEGEPGRPGPPAAPRVHRLIPGDQLEIRILALPELAQIYTVRSDGGFYHPIAGEVRAAGRTLQEIHRDLSSRLGRELRNPACKVGLHGLARLEVSILGEVAKPGKYEVRQGTTLLDVLAMAGGNTEKADLGTLMVMRDGRQFPVSLTPPEPGAPEAPLFTVEPGDIVYLLAGTSVSLVGAVSSPGVYALPRQAASAEEALRRAGGPAPNAALDRVVLQRATAPEPILLDLTPGAGDRLPEAARQLQPGDVLKVPHRAAIVMGGVSKAGPVPLTGEMNILDVISSAGISDPRKLDKVTILRAADIQAGLKKTERVNLTPYIDKGDTSVLVPIRDGDVIYVPSQEQGGRIDFFTPLIWLRQLFFFR